MRGNKPSTSTKATCCSPAEGLTLEAGTLLWDTAHVAPAFDLTIDGIHAYHVTAGEADVLVHNRNCVELSADNTARLMERGFTEQDLAKIAADSDDAANEFFEEPLDNADGAGDVAATAGAQGELGSLRRNLSDPEVVQVDLIPTVDGSRRADFALHFEDGTGIVVESKSATSLENIVTSAGSANAQIGDTVSQVSEYAGFAGRVDVTLSGGAPDAGELLDSVTTVINGNNGFPPPAENITSILVEIDDGIVRAESVSDGRSVVNVLE